MEMLPRSLGGCKILMHPQSHSLRCTPVLLKRNLKCFVCPAPVAQSVACGTRYKKSCKVSGVGPQWGCRATPNLILYNTLQGSKGNKSKTCC